MKVYLPTQVFPCTKSETWTSPSLPSTLVIPHKAASMLAVQSARSTSIIYVPSYILTSTMENPQGLFIDMRLMSINRSMTAI